MYTLKDLIISAIEKSFSSLHIQEAGGFPQFAVVTDGLTGQQAATIPGERLNSVWMVVNHLTLVQDVFNSAFRGELGLFIDSAHNPTVTYEILRLIDPYFAVSPRVNT